MESSDLRITGLGAEPALVGSASFADARVTAGGAEFWVRDATITFRPSLSRQPTLDLHAEGELSGEPFAAYVVGPLNHLVRFFVVEPPLTEDAVRTALTAPFGAASPLGTRFSLRVSLPLALTTEVSDWPEIPTPLQPTSDPALPPEATPPANATPRPANGLAP